MPDTLTRPLLEPDFLVRLEQLELVSRKIFVGKMKGERLSKRITRYVTQIGIEMRQSGGKRRVYRIGELLWEEGRVRVRDWARYDEGSRSWHYPERPSRQAEERLQAAPSWQRAGAAAG